MPLADFQMNRQLQQLLGLWISYQHHSQNSKQEIIRKKERNYSQLVATVQNFLAVVENNNLEILYLCQQYQTIITKSWSDGFLTSQFTNIKNVVNEAQKQRVIKILYAACSRHFGLGQLRMLHFVLIL